MSLKEYVEQSQYNEFNEALDLLIHDLSTSSNQTQLNESIIDTFSSKVKEGIDFIKEFANIVGISLIDLLKIFKEKVVFSFFNKIGWSITKLVSIVKAGYKLNQQLHSIIADFIAQSKITKFTHDKLTQLDQFLNKHPIIKKASSLVVVGFLIYQWTQMISFTGDIAFDFDQSVLLSAMSGSYSLADIFASPDGIKMLLFIGTGVLTGLSFPWPGDAWVLFALSLVYTISKNKYPKVGNYILKNVKRFKGIKE